MNEKKLVPRRRFEEFQNADAWEQRKLDSIYKKVRNAFVGTATPYYVDSGYFYLQSNNVKDGQINRVTEVFINKEFYEKQKDKLLHTGDLVMVQSGHVGHTAVIPKELDGTAAHALIMFQEYKEQVNPYFLNFQFQTIESLRKLESIATGNTIKHILASEMKKFEVSLPQLEEQTQIGNFFKQLDNLITLHQRKLEKTKAMKSAYLAEIFPAEGERVPKRRFAGFTDEWKKFEVNKFADRYNNLRIPITESKRIPGTTPYYGANGIQDYVEGYTHSGEFILLAEDGANNIFDYPVQYVNGKVWVNNHAHVLQAKVNKADNKFLIYLFKKVEYKRYLVGGGRSKLNSDVLMSIELLLPTITEQQLIGEFFKKLDESITNQQQKLKKLKAIKQAYLAEMFV